MTQIKDEKELGQAMHEGEEAPPPGAHIASILRWIVLVLAVLTAGGTSMMALGWIGNSASDTSQYHCPMHPTVVSDRPGDCPICGMDLVPIGEGMGAGTHHDHDYDDEDAMILSVAEQLGARPGQWVCPMPEDGVVRDAPGTCEKCGMSLVQVPEDPALKKAAGPSVYSCPMHPEVHQEGPGKCPICGMHLEKAEAAEPSASASAEGLAPASDPGKARAKKRGVPGLTEVVIPSERLAKIGVKTTVVEQGKLQSQVRTVGVVTADERKRYVVQARFSGWVEELLVDETGVMVRAGQPLVRLYSPELYQAQMDYLNALKWGGELKNAAMQRLQLLGISPGDVKALAASGKPQQTMVLRARSAGHVLAKGVTAGSYVTPGADLFEVADLSRVWVIVDVYEQDIARVKPGAVATFASSARSGERFLGKVDLLYPTVEPTTRTMKIRLEIPNDDRLLRPGMFGDVRLELDAPEGSIVPRDAVIDAGEHVYALVARGGGRFTPREVHVLSKGGDHLLVEGLEPGEEVVTSAGFFVDSESRLRAALAGMAEPNGESGPPQASGETP